MAKFIDLDTGLPALLNKVKAWVNSKLSTKQDAIGDLADIRSGAAAGATALQPADVRAEAPATPDGTFTLNVGSNKYSVNLNHTHENMAKLVVCEESDLPSTLDPATIYAQVDDADTPTEIQSLWIACLEFVGGSVPAGTPVVTKPSGTTINLGENVDGASKTVTIQGRDLTGDLTVAVGTGLSLTYNGTTASSVTIPLANALVGAQVTIEYGGTTALTDGMLSISGGGATSKTYTVTADAESLPSGYTQLDYIENIVKGLDTNILATNSDTIDGTQSGSSWEVDVQCNSTPSSGQIILCTNEDVAHWLQVLNTGNYSVGGGNNLSASITSRNVITVAFTGGGISASIGNETVTRAYTYMNKYSVCLFENINYTMQQYGGLVFKGKIYGAKCTIGGSFNGVPAKRNSDNHFGLYDTANSVFYDLSSNS
jgi:hypothetical protein